MSTTRYTAKDLEKALPELNAKLKKLNSKLFFVIDFAYNRTEIDLATEEQMARHCSDRNLEMGTPRECLAACNKYIAGLI